MTSSPHRAARSFHPPMKPAGAAPSGAGLEIGFAPNWSVGFEYDHIFLDDKDVTLAAAPGGFAVPLRIRQDADLGTVRLNYRFGGPLVAKY